MQGSDRLEEAAASEETQPQTPSTEGAEGVQGDAPAEKAVPKTPRPRAKRASPAKEPTDATAPPAAEAATTDAAAEPKPARAPRRRAAATETPPEPAPRVQRVQRLLEQYRSQITPTLKEEFGYENVMEVPGVQKVVLNIGLGETKTNPRALENALRDLTLIAAQKPITTRARRSIAGFKLREGEPIGTAVTLRGRRMYDFIDRLFNVALPRIRDFHGVSRTAFDGRGNYSLGVREQTIFPEIEYGTIDRARSFQVSFVTTASTDAEALRLLELLGMPFARDGAGVR